jgi:hypothetical protein
MKKYDQIYKDDMSKIIYAVTTGLSFEDADVKPTKENRRFYRGLRSEIEAIRKSGKGIILPN